MISLTYFSTAVEPCSEAELEDLLRDARANNEEAGLTGVLLYADGHFVQTLEGESDDVDELIGVIERDPRHRDVLVAVRESIPGRNYADWSMGFERVDADDAAHIPGFTDYLEHGVDARVSDDVSHAATFHRVFRKRLLGRA